MKNYYANTIAPGTRVKGKLNIPVYLSDLQNNKKCYISFFYYRDRDNESAVKKSRGGELKTGVVKSYNPETNLLAVESKKNHPTIKKYNTKMRYVEPEDGTVSSVSRTCDLTSVPQSIVSMLDLSANRQCTTTKGAGVLRRSRRKPRQNQLRRSMRMINRHK